MNCDNDSASRTEGLAHLLRFFDVADLIAIALPTSSFADETRRVWDSGDAVLPIDLRLPDQAQQLLLTEMAPSHIVTAQGRTKLENPRSIADDIALVMPTSGTTGTPKGVLHSHAGLAAGAKTSNAALLTSSSDTWLACLPHAHIGGFTVLTRAWEAECELEIHDRFEPEAVDASGASMISLVPTMLNRIEPSNFRTILLGGSAVPPDLPSNCVTTYGLTESGAGVVYNAKPLDGVEIKIADHQIWLRGPMLCVGYRDGTTPLDSQGWLQTGDLGSFTDAILTVDGRSSDMIISGGENVWPEPVEQALLRHRLVGEVAIVGEDHPEWGQMVIAKIVPAHPFEIPRLPDLRLFLRDELGPWALPRRIDIVERLPRTSLGKLQRHLLK